MRKNSPTARAIARSRFHGVVTTMLLVALSFMIVKDILVRRISTFASGAMGFGDAARP
jgi:hypothetical protein